VILFTALVIKQVLQLALWIVCTIMKCLVISGRYRTTFSCIFGDSL